MERIPLLVTNNGNTKIKKSAEGTPYRIASLSLAPDDILCPNRKIAACDVDCLFKAGRGQQKNVQRSRRNKTKLWHKDRDLFLDILCDELNRFIKSCKRSGHIPAARLNTISDIAWEQYGVPQLFAPLGLKLYDYTKRADRLDQTPDNYKLMFSYSGAPNYQPEVAKAITKPTPISVVFRGGLPRSFLGRPVIDGDKSDLINLEAENQIIGLKLKGSEAQHSKSRFIVDNPELMGVAA